MGTEFSPTMRIKGGIWFSVLLIGRTIVYRKMFCFVRFCSIQTPRVCLYTFFQMFYSFIMCTGRGFNTPVAEEGGKYSVMNVNMRFFMYVGLFFHSFLFVFDELDFNFNLVVCKVYICEFNGLVLF